MMDQQRQFMAAWMARMSTTPKLPLKVVNNDSVPPPALPENPQPMGEMQLFKRFRDCNPRTFKGRTNAKEVEDQMREVEKIFKVMRCIDKKKLHSDEFSLNGEAQVWWDSMGHVQRPRPN